MIIIIFILFDLNFYGFYYCTFGGRFIEEEWDWECCADATVVGGIKRKIKFVQYLRAVPKAYIFPRGIYG